LTNGVIPAYIVPMNGPTPHFASLAIAPTSSRTSMPFEPDSAKNPNIYLRCKDYTEEEACYEFKEDNCFWNVDVDPPGCRFYVPAEAAGEEPADMSDCMLIKTFLKCQEAAPNGLLCEWDTTARTCIEVEECEDFMDQGQCNEALYETLNIQCQWQGGACGETVPAILQRVRPFSSQSSDSVTAMDYITTFSLAIPLCLISMFLSYICFERRRKRVSGDLDDHFVQM